MTDTTPKRDEADDVVSGDVQEVSLDPYWGRLVGSLVCPECSSTVRFGAGNDYECQCGRAWNVHVVAKGTKPAKDEER